jgi:predicted N-acetyltransferase YhbS
MSTIIREEVRADFPYVFELNKSAFGQDGEARLVETLRNSDAFIPPLSLVAVRNQEIIGHILFTRIKIRNESGTTHDSLALAPMAVKPALQKQGIGSLLIRHGLSKARELGYQSVIVLGHDHYYPKFGFAQADKWDIKSPFDVPPSVFMALELSAGALRNISGTVEYPQAFYEV